MKRIAGFIGMCFLLVCLTACGQASRTEASWNAARQDGSLESYVKDHMDALDTETFREAAENGEASLEQQFHAIALMSMLEYCQGIEDDLSLWGSTARIYDNAREAMYRAEYPVSTPWAESFLARAVTDEEAFRTALESCAYPEDGFMVILAAAKELDGDTLVKLTEAIPEESAFASKLQDAVTNWIKENPESLTGAGERLAGAGYFEDWSAVNWKRVFLSSDDIRMDTVDSAMAYVDCLRSTMIPLQEKQYGADEFQKQSEISGEPFYCTKLAVTVEEELSLQEPGSEDRQEEIPIEGKKVIAFYRNPHREEFPGSPAPLRILGDFMLNLPEQEYPASAGEADYYLVLTPNYEYGGFYQDHATGNDLDYQEVYSFTSIDLYEAGTGVFLRHLGVMIEEAPKAIFTSYGDDPLQYPEAVNTDTLSYIYHHINQPEAYAALTDQIGEQVEFEQEEPAILGGWEITCHFGETVASVKNGIIEHTASEGSQFVRVQLTVANVGLQEATFLPMTSQSQDPFVGITDSALESVYGHSELMGLSDYLTSVRLAPGESRDGELVFEVPDALIDGGNPLYLVVIRGYQVAFFPI